MKRPVVLLAFMVLLGWFLLPSFALEPAKQTSPTNPSYGFFGILRSNFNTWDLNTDAIATHRIVTAHVVGHALTVINYLPARNLVLIWNPWGTTRLYKAAGEKMENGFFWMPLSEFLMKFKCIIVEQ